MTVFDSFINLLQSGMITAFLIHCLGIKRKFQKKAAILVFVTVFFVYLEIQTFFTPFENYGVLLTLLVTGVLSFVFCEKGWIEKCICNVVILMFSVVAAIISGSIAGGGFGTENGGNAFNPAAIRHFYRDIYPVSGHFDRYLRFKIYTGRIKYPVNFHCGCYGNTQPAGCGEARHFTGGTYHRGNDCRESDCVYHDEI